MSSAQILKTILTEQFGTQFKMSGELGLAQSYFSKAFSGDKGALKTVLKACEDRGILSRKTFDTLAKVFEQQRISRNDEIILLLQQNIGDLEKATRTIQNLSKLQEK